MPSFCYQTTVKQQKKILELWTSSSEDEEKLKKMISRKIKMTLYRVVFRPILTFLSESWVLTNRQKASYRDMKYLRAVKGVARKERQIRNEVIREELGVESVLQRIEDNQLKWFGLSKAEGTRPNSETHGVQSEDNSSQPATPHSIISEPLTPRPIPQATSRAAKMRNDKCDEVLDVTQKRFTMPSDVDAKFTLIGKAWACKLKELSQVQATRNSKSLLYLAYTTSIIQSANSTVFTTRVIIKSSNHAIFADASFTNRTILSAPDTIKFTNTSAIFSFFCL
ncbi:unnamed protein product [Acanthoscelides obtectus]|uniref:Uncharacterized protein n=1 Tax=Acanthoscelides obtectus TaxID=200917 RepID=A0A9P0QEV2_ACAOB|nr:unnamed protein product [Acanthoscelides obtectus]CAK1683330.1 hypothetical protein AOBTE_LOCUS34205 [Acanthoscelides obtectus]